jgi:transposase InsO family protein
MKARISRDVSISRERRPGSRHRDCFFLDTYAKVAFAKLYDRKNALVAADLLNDQVLPFFEEQEIPLLRVLTDRGTEYCGQREHHEYELYLAVENIDHSRTKARHPQTNGICERFHRTVQEEFYATAFRTHPVVSRLPVDARDQFGLPRRASSAMASRHHGVAVPKATARPRVLQQHRRPDPEH